MQDYIVQYKELYKIKPNYGKTSINLYDTIISVVHRYKANSILDFGCGKSELAELITEKSKIVTYKYDPAIEEYSSLPNKKVDFIICTDVLQHIPLYDLNRVLRQIKQYTDNCFFYIKCVKHTTLLPNGAFANCTVYNAEWWKKKLAEYFNNITELEIEDRTSVALVTNK